MKYQGYNLRILIYMIIGLVSPLLLHFTDPNAFESWSQYAKHWNEIFLDLTLLAAGLTFIEAGSRFSSNQIVMFKLFKRIKIRIEHWDMFTGIFFLCILLTDVVEDYLEIAHFISTGSAIALAYGRMMFKTNTEYKIIANIGVVGFLIGFLTPLYTTFWGEYIMLLSVVAFFYNINQYDNMIRRL